MNHADSSTATTELVAAAVRDEGQAVARLVERFSPWLLVQARQRLQDGIGNLVEAEDLVHDVWVIVLPRLAEIRAGDGRRTPALVRFLARTLLHRVWQILEREIRARDLPQQVRRQRGGSGPRSVLDGLEAASMREQVERLWLAISSLPRRDQQLLLLRGIEQHDVREVGALLGISANAVSSAYGRACSRLRRRFESPLLLDLLSDQDPPEEQRPGFPQKP